MESDEEVSLLGEWSDSENEFNNVCSKNSRNDVSSKGLKHERRSRSTRIYFSQSSLPSQIKNKHRQKPILTRYLSSPGFICKALRYDPKFRILTKKCSFTRSLDRQPTGPLVKLNKQRPHQRCLFRNATDVAFTIPKSLVKTVLSESKKIKMTRGNMTNGQDSTFSQAVAFRDESPIGQNIELSTLKFADSPSVDDDLADWLLSSTQSTTPSASGVSQNPPPFDVSVSLTDGPSSLESEKSLHNGNGPLNFNNGLDNETPNCSVDKCESIPNNDPNGLIFSLHEDSYAENNEGSLDDTESLASAGYVQNQYYSQPSYYSQQPQQNTADWNPQQHPVQLQGDRRLPDFVTIDQCYRDSEENECSTICLIANLDGLKKEESAAQDNQQVNVSKRGVQKDRTSLRRGVMMRQMSINPDVHPELHHAPGDPTARIQGDQCVLPEAEQLNDNSINKSQETAAISHNNNNLSMTKGQPRKCSFSRNILPPTVVVEEDCSHWKEGADVKRELISDTDKRRGSYSTHQNSVSGRPKMKHLSQNSASPAAMRFRLTFDETADAAANTAIGLPDEVAPYNTAVVKKPSCICGEPELAREYMHESDSGFLRTDQCPLIPRVVTPGSGNTFSLPAHHPDCEDSHMHHSDHIYNVSGQHNIESVPSDYCHSETTVNTQSLPDQCHPRITIRISNSQQSFTPLLSDSPTPGDGFYDICDSNDNNFHMDKDLTTSVSPYPDSQYYHPHPCSMRPFTNEYYPSDPSQILSDHFHTSPQAHQTDTVQAPPIQDLYRYHVFFSHCPEDRDWVEHMVAHLESSPFNYTCAYASIQDEADQTTLQQRILCAAMLSERVVLVLSSRYVQDTWFSFEKTLKQLTQMSLHNQRIMGVLLEDCVIPDSLGELYFLDASDPDFFHVFTKRLKTSRIPRSSASVSSDLGQSALAPANITNGKVLTFCRLQVKVGWDSYLVPTDDQEMEIPSSLTSHGIGMEKAEFGEIVTKVSGIVEGSNKLPWLLSARPMLALLLAGGLWIPAFIAVLVIHVDDDSGIALPVRLGVFLYPLGLVAAGYLIKWRRAYWLTKTVRLLVQNCVDVNQALYFQGRPLFTTAAHVRANIFAVYFVYFDATDCVRSVDLLLITCMEDDWDKLLRLISFYTRDENYLSRMSISERLTVMMSAPYLVKLVRQVLPHPPQQRHVSRLLCLCQFTEECISRFAHGFDREDVPGLAELFTRHLPGKVSGSAVRRVQEELFHANHGLVP